MEMSKTSSSSGKKGGAGGSGAAVAAALQKDVPWRAAPSVKPVPKIHHSPILRLSSNPNSNYAFAVMKHPDPVGEGFATEAMVESAGPDCIVPGLITPVRVLGVKLWPIDVNFKFMAPVTKELKNASKFMESACNLMDGSFQDR